jgi:hypothetical protein
MGTHEYSCEPRPRRNARSTRRGARSFARHAQYWPRWRFFLNSAPRIMGRRLATHFRTQGMHRRLQKISEDRPILRIQRGTLAFWWAVLPVVQAGGCATGDINLGLRAGEPMDGGSPAAAPDAAGTGADTEAGNAMHDAGDASGRASEGGTAGADATASEGGTDAMAGDSGGGNAPQLSSGCGTDPPASDASIQDDGRLHRRCAC